MIWFNFLNPQKPKNIMNQRPKDTEGHMILLQFQKPGLFLFISLKPREGSLLWVNEK